MFLKGVYPTPPQPSVAKQQKMFYLCSARSCFSFSSSFSFRFISCCFFLRSSRSLRSRASRSALRSTFTRSSFVLLRRLTTSFSRRSMCTFLTCTGTQGNSAHHKIPLTEWKHYRRIFNKNHTSPLKEPKAPPLQKISTHTYTHTQTKQTKKQKIYQNHIEQVVYSTSYVCDISNKVM